MLSLSPAKLLIVLVIALIVLGPDKLPHLARRAGALWGDLRRWRARLESEVRSTFPDLPPTHDVVRAVRSPLSFLDGLADAHESRAPNGDGPAVVTTTQPVARSPGEGSLDPTASGRTAAGAEDGEPANDGPAVAEWAAPGGPHRVPPPDISAADTNNGSDTGHHMHDGGVHGGAREAGDAGGTPGWGMDDPAMN